MANPTPDETHPVTLRPQGIGETRLDPIDAALTATLNEATNGGADSRSAVARFVSENPLVLDGWAALGDCGRDDIERYAAYRVGYHRGLDQLRKSGWRGSGFVRWEHEGNRGFLRCLRGLAEMAQAIGEQDEFDRCTLFLEQLDPSWGR